jgi:hypothetical protein
MSNNFDVTDYNVDDIDIDEKVNDWLSNNLSDKIQDLDLVVRAR